MPDTRRLATIALACFALFIASVLLMPLLAPGYDPVDQTISEGVLETAGFVQVAGLLALAGGSLALAWCIVALQPPRAVLPVAALVVFSAACVSVLAVLPTDADGHAETWAGRLHIAAATLAFVSNVAAMLWAGATFRDDPRLSALASVSLAIGAVTLVLLLMLSTGVEPRGLVQRGAVAAVQLWMILVALRLRALSTFRVA